MSAETKPDDYYLESERRRYAKKVARQIYQLKRSNIGRVKGSNKARKGAAEHRALRGWPRGWDNPDIFGLIDHMLGDERWANGCQPTGH